MTRAIFTLVCIFTILRSSAQEYHPFMTGIDSVRWDNGTCFEGCGSFELKVTPVDTVYLDSTWRPLYYSEYYSVGLYSQLMGWLHEDTSTRRVYYSEVYNQTGDSSLLYDFSMNVGDSMIVKRLTSYGSVDSVGWYRVDSISTYPTLVGPRKILYLSSNAPWGGLLRWVEGVGALELNREYPLMDFTNCRFDNEVHVFRHEPLSAWWGEATAIDTACLFAAFGAVPRLDYQQEAQIYPNPATATCSVQLKDANNSLICVMLINSTGQLVTKKQAHGQSAEVTLSGLPTGYYLVVLQTIKGNMVRPLVKQE